jgi:hypothetical protein
MPLLAPFPQRPQRRCASQQAPSVAAAGKQSDKPTQAALLGTRNHALPRAREPLLRCSGVERWRSGLGARQALAGRAPSLFCGRPLAPLTLALLLRRPRCRLDALGCRHARGKRVDKCRRRQWRRQGGLLLIRAGDRGRSARRGQRVLTHRALLLGAQIGRQAEGAGRALEVCDRGGLFEEWVAWCTRGEEVNKVEGVAAAASRCR